MWLSQEQQLPVLLTGTLEINRLILFTLLKKNLVWSLKGNKYERIWLVWRNNNYDILNWHPIAVKNVIK